MTQNKVTNSTHKAETLKAKVREKKLKKDHALPIVFSMADVRETLRHMENKPAATQVSVKTSRVLITEKNTPKTIKAASLADILGFNPRKKPVDDSINIPEKFRCYYKLLIELRNHLTGQINTHSEENLRRSSKDDAGDLSSCGQHMADAGTDAFDRDFALSLVSSEEEARAEIEAAIQRIRNNSYGICESTQKPINKERLLAIPFTRYSAEAQRNIEKNRMRARNQISALSEENFGAENDEESDTY
jgi:RNA polymerase-binding transcription factor DksA